MDNSSSTAEIRKIVRVHNEVVKRICAKKKSLERWMDKCHVECMADDKLVRKIHSSSNRGGPQKMDIYSEIIN